MKMEQRMEIKILELATGKEMEIKILGTKTEERMEIITVEEIMAVIMEIKIVVK